MSIQACRLRRLRGSREAGRRARHCPRCPAGSSLTPAATPRRSRPQRRTPQGCHPSGNRCECKRAVHLKNANARMVWIRSCRTEFGRHIRLLPLSPPPLYGPAAGAVALKVQLPYLSFPPLPPQTAHALGGPLAGPLRRGSLSLLGCPGTPSSAVHQQLSLDGAVVSSVAALGG